MDSTTLNPRTPPAAAADQAGGPLVVDLRGLVKRFGRVTAVDGVDLSIRAGEVVAFLGPNGAGKTSTVDVLLGLSRPTAGSAEVFGLPPADAVAGGLVAAVMQTGGLLKDLTVAETVRLAASLYRDPRPVDEVMDRAGLDPLVDRQVGKCSGGEQQRVRFALALLPDPDLLILDEPTTGMDVESRRAFWTAIRADAGRGRTVLFATHYLQEADAYADRVVMLRQGRVVADGTAAQIRAMGSGRTVQATWPDADPVAVAGWPGVESVEVRRDRLLVRTRDSDAVARILLLETGARDLEVGAHDLEDAFLALTTDPATTPTTSTTDIRQEQTR